MSCCCDISAALTCLLRLQASLTRLHGVSSALGAIQQKPEQWGLFNSKRSDILKIDVDAHVKIIFAIISGPFLGRTCNLCHFF